MQATGELVTCKGICGRELPATEEFFYKSGSGLHSQCKPCYGESRREYREGRVDERRQYDWERRFDPEIHAKKIASTREWDKIRRKEPKHPRLYVLEQAELFKIGYSATINARLSTYRANSALPFYVVGICDGEREDERRIHGRFREYRHHGEWFILPPEQLDAIRCEFMLADNYLWFDVDERVDSADFRVFSPEDETAESVSNDEFVTGITSSPGVTIVNGSDACG